MFFFLTVHEPSWLSYMPVPLFISYHRLARTGHARRVKLPRARMPWAIDSGGFTELSTKGCWTIEPAQYVDDVRRYAEEIGQLAWATPQDWMCEECVLYMTGLELAEHQRRTVASFLQLRDMAPELPWIPVLQGWTLHDYMQCVRLYEQAGVNLLAEPVVGVGTMCRRQATMPAAFIFQELSAMGLRMHGFGVKKEGLELYGNLLESSDSLAWSTRAQNRPALSWAQHKYFSGTKMHAHCNNCPDFALYWRQELVTAYEASLPYQEHTNRLFVQWSQEARSKARVDRDPKLQIMNPYSFISLSVLEGDLWTRFQGDSLDEPTTFFANRTAIAEGSAESGVMLGDEGRTYVVEPTGEIVLLKSTVQPGDVARFKQRLRLI